MEELKQHLDLLRRGMLHGELYKYPALWTALREHKLVYDKEEDKDVKCFIVEARKLYEILEEQSACE